jgi:hypothetical protein
VRILVEETKTPKSADELLNAYAGREIELLKNLRKMKALQDKNAAIRAEVSDLCEKVNSPKTPDELLESYKGREDDLLRNLRKLSLKQQVRMIFFFLILQQSYLPNAFCSRSLLKRRKQCVQRLLLLSRNWNSPGGQMR